MLLIEFFFLKLTVQSALWTFFFAVPVQLVAKKNRELSKSN
jgi:hypothetical protein